MKSMIAGVLALFSFCAHSADADAIQRGKGLFMQHQCYSCHGTEAKAANATQAPKFSPTQRPSLRLNCNCEPHAT